MLHTVSGSCPASSHRWSAAPSHLRSLIGRLGAARRSSPSTPAMDDEVLEFWLQEFSARVALEKLLLDSAISVG